VASVTERTRFYVIESDDLSKIERVMTRLHSEDRLDGDSMRDLGHVLEVVVRHAKDFEYEPEAAK
jgi:hypothetical protein